MKSAIRNLLRCPTCQQEVGLQVLKADGEEILEGLLNCPCGLRYPIIKGVPRMLPPDLLASLEDDYPEFFSAYGNHGSRPSPGPGWETDVRRRTQLAFGYEWTWAADYNANNFSDWLPEGMSADGLFAGKVGLEIGCGGGRHAAMTASVAREHFAVDLSSAVDVAFERVRRLDNCHVVQADVFQLPFPKASFDYVYCLGVIQHLPDPERGFQILSEQPRPDGILLVNVYQASRPLVLFMLELARKVTTRLPHGILSYVCVAAGCLDYGMFIGPWKKLRTTSAARVLRQFVPSRVDEYAKHDFHTCVTDWFDRLSCPVKKHYQREDLARWFTRAGYADVVVTPYWKAFWNGFGRKRSESPSPAQTSL